MNNIEILTDTLNIMSQGYYVKNGKKIDLKLNTEERKTVKVFLPEEVHALEHYSLSEHIHVLGKA